MSETQVKNGYFPRLDGLRFLAFLMVFLEHGLFDQMADPQSTHAALGNVVHRYGYLGVDFFFVLSAFLLTFLAVQERSQQDGFDLKGFYKRRALRVLPLYFLLGIVAVAGMAIMEHFTDYIPSQWSGNPFPAYLTLTLNYFMEYVGEHFWFSLTFMWTVCVEVHFYLLAGVAFKKWSAKLPGFFTTMIVIGFMYKALRQIIFESPTFFDTLNYFPHFGIGGVLGWALASGRWQQLKISRINAVQQSLIGIGLLALLLTHLEWRSVNVFFYAMDNVVYALFFAWAIVSATFWKHSIWRWADHGLVQYLGKISYGSYVFHGVVLMGWVLYAPATIPWWIAAVVCLLWTIIIAMISYRFFEKPIMRFKRS